MKTKYVLPIIYLFLVFVSCKKKTTPAESGPGTSVSNQTSPINLSNCYGKIIFGEDIKIGQGAAGVMKYAAEGFFYSSPILDPLKRDEDVGTVTVNGTRLKKNGGITTHLVYTDSTNQLFSLSAFTLNASGSSTVTKFNFQYAGGSPVFGDTSSIPSVIQSSVGINLTLKNITNADSMFFTLSRDYYQSITKRIFAAGLSEVKIEIKSQDIRDMMQNHIEASINVIVSKNVLARVGSRDYLISSQKNYSRPVMVTPF